MYSGWNSFFVAFAIASVVGLSAFGQTIDNIELELNPSGNVPLAAQLTFTTDTPTVATLHIYDGKKTKKVTPNSEYTTEHDLMVLGLRPDRINTVRVTVKDRSGRRASTEKMELETGPLPDNFPPIDVKISRPRRMEPGYTMVPFFRWAEAGPDKDYGLVLALDAHGEVVWYYETDVTVSDLVPTRDGTFTYQISRNGRMREIDMLGNLLREWHTTGVPKEVSKDSIPVDTDIFHHDHQSLPNGNILALSTEVRNFEDYPSSEIDLDAAPEPSQVIGDVIVEFRQDGTMVREFRVMDILDPYRIGYGSLATGFYADSYKDVLEKPAKDWAHTNSIFYDEANDAAILSSYHLDVVYKVDLKTGELVWLLGNHEDWGEPWQKYLLTPDTEDFLWNSHQHSAKLTPHGTVIIFDNGTNRARPGQEKLSAEDSWSRAVEFEIDEEARTVSQVWAYGGPEDEIFFSPFISEVDWLPVKENILITDGGRMRTKDGEPSGSIFGGHHFARILEVTHDTPAKKVFEIVIDDPAMGWAVYRSERVPSLYP